MKHVQIRKYDTFAQLYQDAFNIAFPFKLHLIPRKYLKRSPWMSKSQSHSVFHNQIYLP